MSQGGGTTSSNNYDPYQGTGRVFLNNTTTPDKVFGTGMPSGQATPEQPTPTQIYGNDNYVNPNLQGYSQTEQNIVSLDQLNSQAPMTPEQIEQMRRQSLMTTTQPQPAQPTVNPTQMYMQAPVVPQVSDMQPSSYTNAPAAHDLSTAEGNLDYLNAIAPTVETKKGLNLPVNSKLFVVAGVGILVLVIVAAIAGALGNTGPSLSKATAELGKSLANLQEIVDYGEQNAKYANVDLTNVTAETQLIMLSHQTTLGKLVTLGTVDEDGDTEEATADETVTERLDEAKATGKLGEEYRDELKERLTKVSSDLATAYEAAKKADVRTALDDSYRDAQRLLQRIDEVSTDSGGQATD